MKALILIGGMGTRLRPLTLQTPKPLLPIVNRPFLEYQFELLKRHGVKEVILCVAYLSHEFEKYFGDGSKFGLKVRYVHEKDPLGTGGAIKNAGKYIDEPTLIFNGDILTDINLKAMSAFHKSNKAKITIALTRVKDPTLFGLVETHKDGKIERFLEKPTWDEVTCNTINAGIYIFEPEMLQMIPYGINYSVERGLFPDALNKNLPIYGFTFKGYWMDIGTLDKYMAAHCDIMLGHAKFALPGKKRATSTWAGDNFKIGKHSEINGKLVCGRNVKIGDFAVLKGNVCLGNNVTISKGASISDSVILSGTRIDEGVRIENSLIGQDCRIEANSVLNSQTTLGNNTIIKKYSRI